MIITYKMFNSSERGLHKKKKKFKLFISNVRKLYQIPALTTW